MTATLAPPALCPCGNPKQRTDWQFCIACLVGIDNDGLEKLRVERDAVGEWLPIADEVLQAMDRDDPRYIKGLEIWNEKERWYRTLCTICPETV